MHLEFLTAQSVNRIKMLKLNEQTVNPDASVDHFPGADTGSQHAPLRG